MVTYFLMKNMYQLKMKNINKFPKKFSGKGSAID